MSTVAEQLSAATKASIEANLALFSEFTTTTFAGVEKLIDLNLNTVRASLEDSNLTTKQLFAAKDPQDFFSLSAAQAQPNTEKAIAYGRHFANIASNTQTSLTKATETHVAETRRKVIELVEQVSKNAPPGTESAIAFVKSAISNANAGYEQLSKSTKQVVETVENNVNNAVDQFSQAAIKTTARPATKK